jgi:hypothetical protein
LAESSWRWTERPRPIRRSPRRTADIHAPAGRDYDPDVIARTVEEFGLDRWQEVLERLRQRLSGLPPA